MTIPHNLIMDSVVNRWTPLNVALTTTAVDVFDLYTGVSPFQVLLRSPGGKFQISNEEAGAYVEIDEKVWFPLPVAAKGQLWAKAVTGAVTLHVVVLGNA